MEEREDEYGGIEEGRRDAWKRIGKIGSGK